MNLPPAKAGPIRNGGNASGISDLRRRSKKNPVIGQLGLQPVKSGENMREEQEQLFRSQAEEGSVGMALMDAWHPGRINPLHLCTKKGGGERPGTLISNVAGRKRARVLAVLKSSEGEKAWLSQEFLQDQLDPAEEYGEVALAPGQLSVLLLGANCIVGDGVNM
ncbi:hypothetical protein DUI87_10493 [Hirundo rustica rustica]|uniref:Uncharacterized protein n=1 Tax=Hirundo rustica rustica TaxID=333673 RepID=A0A3M0KIT2_HIRRU|nr:hypothetical protein DUI87_10493 [Hirundo rustica rustica]